MKEEDLKRLIDRYYSGESTEEEEIALRDYFRKGNIPEGYEAEKVIFGFYSESEEMPEPSIDFEARILAGIDASERESASLRLRKYLLPLISTAAGLLLLAGSYFYFVRRAEPSDTFKDPAMAYAETIKILREVSLQLNRGTQVLEPVGKMNEATKKSFETLNKSTRMVQKNLKSLDYLKNSKIVKQFPSGKSINK
jgi:hypothetical protein